MTAVGRVTTLVINGNDIDRLAAFWSELLDLEVTSRDEGWIDLASLGGGPVLAFQRVPEVKTTANRLHLDVAVSQLDAAVSRARALGGTVLRDHGGWQVVADPEGNEFCLVRASG